MAITFQKCKVAEGHSLFHREETKIAKRSDKRKSCLYISQSLIITAQGGSDDREFLTDKRIEAAHPFIRFLSAGHCSRRKVI